MAKRGPKRKPGPRTRSGQRSKAYKSHARDEGTPEVQTKRKAIVGVNDKGEPNDPTLSATALDILLAHRHITGAQHTAGQRFRRLHWALYGRPWANAAGDFREWPERCSRGVCTEEDCKNADQQCPAGITAEYRRLSAAMTAPQRDVVIAVAAYGHIPYWLDARRLGLKLLPEDDIAQRLLQDGLEAIARANRIQPEGSPPIRAERILELAAAS